MQFEITSSQDVSIDGIGVLKSGVPRKVSAEELHAFEVLNHIPLAKAKFPDFVRVEFVVEEV